MLSREPRLKLVATGIFNTARVAGEGLALAVVSALRAYTRKPLCMARLWYGLSKREPIKCHTVCNAFGLVGSVMASSSYIIAPARFPEDLELVRALFVEYI
jgi:hypothetical protein